MSDNGPNPWYSEDYPGNLGPPPNITGSEVVANLTLSGLDDLVGTCFLIDPDSFKAADLIDKRIKNKRTALGLGA